VKTADVIALAVPLESARKAGLRRLATCGDDTACPRCPTRPRKLTNRSAVVPAGMLNAGIELISSRSFSLDVELRGGTGFYDHNDVQIRNVMLGVAVNFF